MNDPTNAAPTRKSYPAFMRGDDEDRQMDREDDALEQELAKPRPPKPVPDPPSFLP
jgi:hypothetical protein